MEAKLVSKLRSDLNEAGYHISSNTTDQNLTTSLHYHDYYELMIYLGYNPMSFMVNKKKYTATRGDIVLVNIFEPHEFQGDKTTKNERVCIGIDPAILLSHVGDENLLNLFKEENPYYPVIHTEIWKLEKYLSITKALLTDELRHGDKIRKRALVLQMLANVYDDCYVSRIDDSANSKKVEMVSNIIRYVDDHLREKITIRMVADEVNYSESYVGKVFKEMTNQPLTTYIVNKRLIKAASYLRDGYPVMDVPLMVGFNNYSYFYKAFKKLNGVAPAEYQKAIKEK